jgi:hypothetical protein
VKPFLVLSLTGLLVGCSGGSQNTGAGQNSNVWTLPSGQKVLVLGTTKLYFSSGDNPCLMLRYQTDISITDVQNLEKQADQVWSKFKQDVEKDHFICGATKAQEKPTSEGLIKRYRAYTFVFKKSPDGTWSELQKH